MVLRVKDLADGDSRAAFKTVNLDLRQYQRLKMFIHGERIHPDKLNEGDLTVFIRIGADYKDNYYEYEIPLKPTDFPGEAGRQYDNDNNTDRLDVWPLANTVDIDLEMFQNVKLERNDKQPNDALKIYSIYDGNRKISIRGNPSLSNIRTIMIGVRNPSTTDKRGYKNDGLRKSAEVWVNELRLSDFNNKGGWGANARSQIKLADLGMISVSGSTMKPGFGSIEKKVNDREKVETNQFDVATNIDFGRFFKEEAAVQFPIYASYSKTVINPQYNPLQPDIPLDLALREAASKVERDSIKYKAQDLTSRLSVNLTNAKIGKPKQKPKFYDPANFSTTVSYNRLFSHNPTTYKNELLNYRGGLNYMFTQRAEPVQPLKNVKFLKHKAFTLIRDFNFYYKPQTVMFRTDLNRTYRRVELRNLNYIPGDNSAANKETLDPSYMRDFLWNRMYDVKFDLTRTLKLTYNGTNSSRIDEYYGEDLTNPDPRYFDSPQYKEQNRETMMNSIKHGGRNVKYMHNFDLTYTLPINKIPGFDWLSASARYGATYNWDRQPTLREGMTEYGHTIKNSNQTSLTGQANLVTLYNKVPYFKKLNQPKKKVKDVETKTVTYEQEVLVLKAKVKKTIRHNLNTEDVKVKVKDKSGAEIKGNVDVVDKNRIAFTCDEEKNNVTFVVEGKVPLKPSVVKFIVENTFKMMMGVKNIGGTYTFNQGTTLPGFNYESNILGMDPSHAWAPGLPFIFGMQDNSFYKTASDNHFDAYALSKGWLYSPSVDSLKSALNMPMIVTHNNQINLRSNVEPLPGLKIDLTAMRTYTESLSRMYLYKGDTAYSDKMMGNFSMSFLGIRTFFEKLDPAKDYESKSFNNFKALTVAKSNQLAEERLASGIDNSYAGGVYVNDSTVFPDYREGFGPTSQQVLIPSFLSAYSGMNMNNKLIKSIPLNGLFMFMPNWRLTFDGLNKIALVQKYFKSIVITHAYQATYNIGSFLSDYKYAEDELRSMDLNNNFRSKYEIGSISINESFNPLFNLDMTWVNNLTSRIGYRDMRSLIMSLYNNQLTETRSKEITVGLGYRFNEVPIKLITSAGEKNAKSDLKMQCDVSVRDDKTIFRRLIEETTSPNAGKKVVTIKFSIDYQLSSSFTMRIFYDRIYTNPFVSNAFQTTNSNVGFSVRFTLVQQQQ